MRSFFRKSILVGLLVAANQLASFAQGGVTVRRYFDDETALVKEEYTVRDTLSNILEGPFTSYFSNGRVESRGQWRNNLQEGPWSFYYENGNLRMQGEYVGGRIVGRWKYYYEKKGNLSAEGILFSGLRQETWTEYFESSQRKSEGKYLDGKKVGVWNYFYEDGTLKAQAFYENGKGIYEEYYASGKTKARGLNINGRSDSTWVFYFENGAVQSQGKYQSGIRQGAWSFYYDNGNLMAEGAYQEGQPDGKWNYYYEDGSLNSEGALQMGRKEGFWKIYDRQGGYKAEGIFEEGAGLYREYFASGKLRAEGRIIDDKKEGQWRYFYEDGHVEGECFFNEGRGEYIGYYPDGAVKTRGIIEDGKWIGEWQLYNEAGELAGYYRPVYQDENPLLIVSSAPPKPQNITRIDDKPEYQFREQRFKNFRAVPGEFVGVILGGNVLFGPLGWIPVSVELWYQERLGYELEAGFVRRPFFEQRQFLGFDNMLEVGGYLAARQKFYSKDRAIGMLYFGHELRYAAQNRYSKVNIDDELTEVSGVGQQFEYSVLFGTRFAAYSGFKGFTMDVYGGVGVGYHILPLQGNPELQPHLLRKWKGLNGDVFLEKPFGVDFRFGINVGWIFPTKKKD